MKLYGNPVLPFSRLVETVAQFTKTEYDFQMVDLFSGPSQKMSVLSGIRGQSGP